MYPAVVSLTSHLEMRIVIGCMHSILLSVAISGVGLTDSSILCVQNLKTILLDPQVLARIHL